MAELLRHWPEMIEVGQAWLYRASIYSSNVFLDDPAILAFAFC
ncbi:hypothetical protein [Polynucleobacter sp. TUM22923]|jgi:hypothetical protein|nr:hypothetical protein [Polynucleobacter sp. TUM22923]